MSVREYFPNLRFIMTSPSLSKCPRLKTGKRFKEFDYYFNHLVYNNKKTTNNNYLL